MYLTAFPNHTADPVQVYTSVENGWLLPSAAASMKTLRVVVCMYRLYVQSLQRETLELTRDQTACRLTINSAMHFFCAFFINVCNRDNLNSLVYKPNGIKMVLGVIRLFLLSSFALLSGALTNRYIFSPPVPPPDRPAPSTLADIRVYRRCSVTR